MGEPERSGWRDERPEYNGNYSDTILIKRLFCGVVAETLRKTGESDDLPPAHHNYGGGLFGGTAMLCETCRWTERPGFIRRPKPSPLLEASPAQALPPGQGDCAEFIPCPDCGGQAIAHCCEGLCAQPDF